MGSIPASLNVKSARVVCYALASFLIIFVLAALSFILRLWVSFAVSVPARTSLGLESIIPALRWALAFTLYLGILITMNYAFRKRVHGFLAFILTSGIFFGLAAGASALIDNLRFVDAAPLDTRARILGGKGLILPAGGLDDGAIVLLDGAEKPPGARVIAVPGENLIYREAPPAGASELSSLPAVPFSQSKRPFFEAIRIDVALSAWNIASRFERGFAPFALWTGALIAALASLALILRIGSWPLAGLFWGAALARGLLSLEAFLNSKETQRVIGSFLRGLLPADLAGPLVFAALAALMLAYVILLSIAQGSPPHA